MQIETGTWNIKLQKKDEGDDQKTNSYRENGEKIGEENGTRKGEIK